jgi:hypothetical protein
MARGVVRQQRMKKLEAAARRPGVVAMVIGGVGLLVACASGAAPPLVASHPASPEGAEVPWPEAASSAPQPGGEMGHEHHHGAAPAASSGAVIYACPMHPEVTSNEPGTCPKCGMLLRPQP